MRRHAFDAFSFLLGLLFLAAGLALLGATAIHDGLALPWAGPIVAVGLAVLIILAVRPRSERVATDGVPATEDEHPA